MRISTGSARLRSAQLVVACACLCLGACSGGSTFPGPSWNLTGGRQAAELPAKPVATPLAPQQSPNTYRGGRDPVTGRAATFGGSPQAFPLPPAAPDIAARTPPPAATQPMPVPGVRASQVEVRPGQSLAAIAAEQRVSIASLMAANKLRDPYVIPGQVLAIPRQ